MCAGVHPYVRMRSFNLPPPIYTHIKLTHIEHRKSQIIFNEFEISKSDQNLVTGPAIDTTYEQRKVGAPKTNSVV